MAVIKNFRATTLNRAFILNSLVTTITVMVAMFVKTWLERAQHGDQVKTLDAGFIVATIGATFVASMAAYYVMHWVFGYGEGLIASNVEIHLTHSDQKKIAHGVQSKDKSPLIIHASGQSCNPKATKDPKVLNPFPHSLTLGDPRC